VKSSVTEDDFRTTNQTGSVKLFTVVTITKVLYTSALITAKHFHPSLIFAVKARSLTLGVEACISYQSKKFCHTGPTGERLVDICFVISDFLDARNMRCNIYKICMYVCAYVCMYMCVCVYMYQRLELLMR
jgi:hypothetical protein